MSDSERLAYLEKRVRELEQRGRWRHVPRHLVADVTDGSVDLQYEHDIWFIDLNLSSHHIGLGEPTPRDALDALMRRVEAISPTDILHKEDLLTELQELRALLPEISTEE